MLWQTFSVLCTISTREPGERAGKQQLTGSNPPLAPQPGARDHRCWLPCQRASSPCPAPQAIHVRPDGRRPPSAAPTHKTRLKAMLRSRRTAVRVAMMPRTLCPHGGAGPPPRSLGWKCLAMPYTCPASDAEPVHHGPKNCPLLPPPTPAAFCCPRTRSRTSCPSTIDFVLVQTRRAQLERGGLGFRRSFASLSECSEEAG